MDAIFGLIALAIATTLAGAFAFTIHWLFLRAAFAVMRPAPAPAPRLAPRVNPAAPQCIAA
jgi:hypothetical protein